MLYGLILYISGETYSFKVDSEIQIFEKLFMAILFDLRVFARNLLRESSRRNTFCISFRCLVWGSNPNFTSNKPTHYLLDYGDFMCTKYLKTLSTTVGRQRSLVTTLVHILHCFLFCINNEAILYTEFNTRL